MISMSVMAMTGMTAASGRDGILPMVTNRARKKRLTRLAKSVRSVTAYVVTVNVKIATVKIAIPPMRAVKNAVTGERTGGALHPGIPACTQAGAEDGRQLATVEVVVEVAEVAGIMDTMDITVTMDIMVAMDIMVTMDTMGIMDTMVTPRRRPPVRAKLKLLYKMPIPRPSFFSIYFGWWTLSRD